jgi:quercetin dioxygenase-like cupin family protein
VLRTATERRCYSGTRTSTTGSWALSSSAYINARLEEHRLICCRMRTIFPTSALLATALLFFGWAELAQAQATEKVPSEQEKNRPKLVVFQPGEPAEQAYDAGAIRFLVSSEDTKGAWSLVQLTEMPGYHTNFHRHNHTDEAFYVLEGVLTVKTNDATSEYPAGSYVLIPRGTPHAQGNFGKVPVKLLLTMTPAGFERSFKERVELFKTLKPDDPEFRKKRKENAVKGNYDVEFLVEWNPHK